MQKFLSLRLRTEVKIDNIDVIYLPYSNGQHSGTERHLKQKPQKTGSLT